jgi:RHS repeat-associated protein
MKQLDKTIKNARIKCSINQLNIGLFNNKNLFFIVKENISNINCSISIESHRLNFIKDILMKEGSNYDKDKQVYIFLLPLLSMRKRGFFYLKNTLILSVLLFLILSIPPVFASQINQTLTYDGNGNLITGDGKYREYNEFNQLLRVYDGSYPNGTILESYLYHPTEDRILIKYGDYASSTPGDAVVYVNENLEKSYDNLGGTPRTNYTYYTFDENGLMGQITKNNTNGTLRTLYYHNDYSGTVSLITNSSGNIVEQTFYDPFGAILAGGDASRYSYEGKEFSSVTEDFDFHFRKYDPSLMIFTQPDSVIANVYDPQSLNRYSFEKNNPYKYVDKDGKFAVLAPLLIAAGIGFVAGGIAYFATTSAEDRTLGGFLAYAGGGALGGVIAVGAVLIAPTALATTAAVLGGAAGGMVSQAISNVGTNKPVSEDLLSSAIIGGVTGGLAEEFLPFARIKSIKYSTSYFTTKTGQRYIINNLLQSGGEFDLNYAYDLAKEAISNNAGGSSGGRTTYCLGNQCYCGCQPSNTYDSTNGVYIDENRNGFSVAPENIDKLNNRGNII